MATNTDHTYTRRKFLERGLLFASAATTVPAFLHHSATSIYAQTSSSLSSIPGVPQDRILVVLQLAGGNDGLNTVVPFRNDNYYRVRPQIGIAGNDVLQLGQRDEVGLHPAMDAMKGLYDDGLLGIIQGVGYPNPNRSHFASMDIWHTASTDGVGEGWLGRFFDNECSGSPNANNTPCAGEAAVAFGREAPLAMQGRSIQPINFENEDLFRWIGEDLGDPEDHAYDKLMHPEQEIGAAHGSNADFLTRTTLDAQVTSDKMRKAVSQRSLVQYPRNGVADQLKFAASMIRAGLDTRVFYVSTGGFDTHAGQGGAQGRHANLLRDVSTALAAFYADLKAQGNEGRVLTMTFSEFGRRVGQNASGGTDHGTAAPLFLAGPMVRQGVIGKHPSLTDLDEGDLKFTTDFRSIYAAVLEDWLGVRNSAPILGDRYRKANILSI